MQKKIAETEQALVAANAESAALKDEIVALKRDTVPAQQLKALETQLADATKARNEQQAAREELQKSLSALEAEKTDLAGKLAALTEAGIKVPTPQRDLHIRGMEPMARQVAAPAGKDEE